MVLFFSQLTTKKTHRTLTKHRLNSHRTHAEHILRTDRTHTEDNLRTHRANICIIIIINIYNKHTEDTPTAYIFFLSVVLEFDI